MEIKNKMKITNNIMDQISQQKSLGINLQRRPKNVRMTK